MVTFEDLLIYSDWLEENYIKNDLYKSFLNLLRIRLKRNYYFLFFGNRAYTYCDEFGNGYGAAYREDGGGFGAGYGSEYGNIFGDGVDKWKCRRCEQYGSGYSQ